jgi:hypothetical protein
MTSLMVRFIPRQTARLHAPSGPMSQLCRLFGLAGIGKDSCQYTAHSYYAIITYDTRYLSRRRVRLSSSAPPMASAPLHWIALLLRLRAEERVFHRA